MNNRPISSPIAIQRLNPYAVKLSRPHNFYAGYQTNEFALPNNILMFHNRIAFDNHSGSAHNRYVLIVPIQTDGQVIVDHTIFDLRPGMVLLIHPWQLHRYANFQSETVSWLFITFDIAPSDRLNCLRNKPAKLNTMTLINLLEQTCRHYAKLNHHQTNTINLLRLDLAIFLQRLVLQYETTSHLHTAPQISPLISQVGQLVVSTMNQPISVTQLAEELAISPSHLRNRFRQEYHIGVLQYIHQLKMLHAMRLLCTTELTISQIAQHCGFNSLFSFSRVFKRHANISPRAYRLLNR
ncbi:MAG: hypothetical protein CMJ19_20095 [Phycisphaeraceae bacterium]|nr:hypothetical protein [Phycisphaeraceae bacterium]